MGTFVENTFTSDKIEAYFEGMLKDIWNFPILTVENNSITLGTITVGLILLVLGVMLAKYLSRKISRKILIKTGLDKSIRHSLESMFFYIFLIFFSLFAMRMANLPITIFTVIGGALAIGIGFGSQNIVNNFISGIILMIERPIKVSDFIEIDGLFGVVQDIGTRSTVVRSFGNKHIIVPNSSFLEKNVLNWTYQADNEARLHITVGVAYGSDTALVKKLLLEAVKTEKRVLKHRELLVLFKDFGDSSLVFECYFWIRLQETMDRQIVESNIRFKIDQLFRENHVKIPFPQRDVHIQQPPTQ